MIKFENVQAKRLYDSLCETEGEVKANQILDDLPLSENPTNEEKYEWACNMCNKLNKNFSKETVTQIRKGCKCGPVDEAIQLMKSLWDKSDSVEDFTRRSRENPNAHSLVVDGDTLIMTYPHCYCDFVSHTEKLVPSTWCDCTLGYAEKMFDEVTGHSTKAELLESVITGGKMCRIRIHI